MTAQLNGRWDAASFFENLTATNKLAQQEQFVFCRVSGLDGFEEAVNQAQTQTAFVCVSDIADGYTELNNTPRTRRVKTVFLAMRHAAEDMEARSECMETMRELFRQFMSRLLPKRSGWSRTASILTQEYRSTRLTDIFSTEPPEHTSKSPSMCSPI